jgi:FixJ family two-component response regulator
MFAQMVNPSGAGSDKVRVMVVDDDAAVRDSLKFALELEGLSVQTWPSGQALLESGVLEADCLVLDCKMPEMDGFSVMAVLADRNISIPVILITAPVTGAMRRQAAQIGAFSLLEKPLDGGVLLESIRCATA